MSDTICCPKCSHAALVETASYDLRIYVCSNPDCRAVGPVPPDVIEAAPSALDKNTRNATKLPKPTQLKLGIEPGRQTTAIVQNEEAVQRQTIGALCARGYLVLQTSVRYKFQRCPSCGKLHRPTGGYGASKGVPDLLVRHPDWVTAIWLGLEQKGSRTALSPEQKQMLKEGHIFVSRSVEEALLYVQWADRSLSHVPADFRLFSP